jgi:hypothetical protein
MTDLNIYLDSDNIEYVVTGEVNGSITLSPRLVTWLGLTVTTNLLSKMAKSGVLTDEQRSIDYTKNLLY